LSDESYTLGSTLASFLHEFGTKYDSEHAADLLPRPLEEIKQVIETTVDALFSHYNFGKSNSEKMMPYCRPAVEKFVFSKLHSNIFPIYQTKMRDTD
jgi:hypothetical protein